MIAVDNTDLLRGHVGKKDKVTGFRVLAMSAGLGKVRGYFLSVTAP